MSVAGQRCVLARHSQRAGIPSVQPFKPKTTLVFDLYSLISPDILDGFSQSFHHMKALYVQMMDLYLIFQFVKGRFDRNQIILPL